MSLLHKALLLTCLLFQISLGVLDSGEQAILSGWYNSLYYKGILTWNVGNDLCTQSKVTCDRSTPQKVTKLDFLNLSISGTLSTGFGSLSSLQELGLSNNQFSGTIPTQIGQLTNLQSADFSANKFSGPIPTEFGTLTSLQYLWLNVNQLSGTIPSELLSLQGLQSLYLQYNNLQCPVSYYGSFPNSDYNNVNTQCGTSCPSDRCLVGQVCSITSSNGFTCANTGCGENGIEVNGECACSSGYSGAHCDDFLGGICSFPTSAPLTTDSLGELHIINNITNSLIEVLVTVPGAEKRTVSSIVFGDTATSSNAVCAYPGPSFTKDYDQSICEDTFLSSISIVDLIQNCGFDLDTGNTGDFKEYDGRIWITIVEDLGSFRSVSLTRTISSSLNLILSLPSTVTVNGSISLFGAAESIFVLTDQTYDETTDSGIVTITSILSYPYKFSSAVFSGSSVFTIQASPPQDQTCDDNSGDCVQTTTFTIQDISTNGCTFTGDYDFEWAQSCRGSTCPSTLDPISATVSLESSNVCSSIKVYSSITATLDIMDSQSILRATYVVGESIYFNVQFFSDVDVDHYQLVNVYITYDSDQRYLFQNGQSTSIGTANSFSIISYDRFSFSVSVGTDDTADLILSASDDIAMTFNVYVEYEIFYKTTFKKRSIESQKLGISREILVTSRSMEAFENSSSSLVSSFSLILIITLSFFFAHF